MRALWHRFMWWLKRPAPLGRGLPHDEPGFWVPVRTAQESKDVLEWVKRGGVCRVQGLVTKARKENGVRVIESMEITGVSWVPGDQDFSDSPLKPSDLREPVKHWPPVRD